MKILVISNLPHYVLGGAENQTANLIEHFLLSGHVVKVAGHLIPNGFVKFKTGNIESFRIQVLKSAGRAGKAISYFLSLSLILIKNKNQFDIIYCRFLADSVITICILKHFFIVRIPIVSCPASAGEKGAATFLESLPLYRSVIKLLNNNCDAINIIAPGIQKELLLLGFNKKLFSHIPNGVALKPLPNKMFRHRRRRMVFVGRLVEQKGLIYLLQALKTIVKQGLSVELSLIGSGAQKDELILLTKELEITEYVLFLGEYTRTKIREALIQYDVFILPSLYEGLSNACLEAMEVGLPIICTRCGGIDQHLDSSIGWVCKPRNIQELSIAIKSMLLKSDKELKEMGHKARKIIEAKFEMASVADKHIEMFSRLISCKNR